MIEGESRERLKEVIARMEATADDEWLMHRVSSKGNKQNCCLGHVFFMGGDDVKACNDWMDWFESCVATEFMVFPINDGADKRYPQATPKARILAYLNDILEGREQTSWDLMDEYMSQTATK